MRTQIYRKAIVNARELMKEKTEKNKAPSWILTELAQKVGKELAKEFNVDENIVQLTLYLQHLIFDPITGGYIQKNHPSLSVEYIKENKLLEEWNIPEDEREIILEAILNHHKRDINKNLIIEVIKNAECQKFVTVEGSLIWLHELGLRGFSYEESEKLVFYKMNQKKELLTLEKCIKRGNVSCKEIENMFKDKKYISKLKKLHELGLNKIPYEESILKVNLL